MTWSINRPLVSKAEPSPVKRISARKVSQLQLTYNSHYNPCFWTAHWNTQFLEAALKGRANYGVAREQTVYALNVKSDKIRKTSVADVHYDKGVGVAEITPEAALAFCKRTQPDKYDEYCEYFKQNPETMVLDVEAILTGLEETEAYATLKKVLVKGRIYDRYEKALLGGFIAVHHARSHAVLNSMMQLDKEAGIHWFESVLMLKQYLGNHDVLFQHVMTYASGYFTLFKLAEDTFPLNDSPILIKPKSIMVALSPRLLLEIDRTRNNIPHDCCISNFIRPEKLEEFRRRTIGNTFREIIFGDPALLEEWRSTPDFAKRHALMANVKSYNAVVTKYAGREIWRINAHSDHDDESAPIVIGPCWVLLHPGVPHETIPENVVRIDFGTDGCRGSLIPLFTDPEFAGRFIASFGERAKGMTIFQPVTLCDLECLLMALKQAGTTHVHFNAMPPGSPSPEPVPIGEVIASLAVVSLNAKQTEG
jgi:hypothetical protein